MKRMLPVLALSCCTLMAAAEPVPGARPDPPRLAPSDPFPLAPPMEDGPVMVGTRFELYDILEINDDQETFMFSGVLTLTWKDPIQAFDPAAMGVKEKIFQGNFQFDELSAGWYPQVILANQAGLYQRNGITLRVLPDGTSTLFESITATAKVDLDLRRLPFDRHRLEAVFEVLGFDRDEVRMEVDPANPNTRAAGNNRIPQWQITGSGISIRDHSDTGHRGHPSAAIVRVEVVRNSFHIIRLVVFPLIMIVLLSFSVFWMDRSSLGDRMSVSFIGILTSIAFQLVISDKMPSISYFTLIHGFLNLSFIVMGATIVINLRVGGLDQRGKRELGDRIDHRCRRVFPIAYFGLILVMVGVAFLFY